MDKRSRLAVALLSLITISSAACSDEGDGTDTEGASPSSSSTTRSTTPATTTTTALDVPAVSFSGTREAVDLGGGWTVVHCEGDGPLLCVSKDGNRAGVVELSAFPVDSFHLEGFDEAVKRNDSTGAMEILAADFVRAFVADRKDGCGSDYEIEPTPTGAATVLGRQGLRYGFTGVQNGKLVERQVSHGAIAGDDVLLANASGYSPDGCVPPEGEFTPEALEEFEPRLRAMIATASR